MSWVTPAELSDRKYYVCREDGSKDLSEKLSVPALGQIPIIQIICGTIPSEFRERSANF